MNYSKHFLIKLISFIIICVFPLPSSYSQNLLNGPNDIVFDQSKNRYLVANWAGNNIVAIDSNDNHSYFLSDVTHAHGMEIKGNLLYVASYQNLLLIDLNSASITESIFVPESDYLGHIALDSSYYVYVSDWSAQKLFKININDHSTATLHTFNSMPVGISYEQNNHRLIILTLVENAPILAYNLNGGNIDTVRNTSINDPDAICRDGNGNYFVTSFSDNIVYRFGNNFSSGPDIISSGHGGPSGISYNIYDNVIGVTNYNFNSIDLIQLEPSDVKLENSVELYNFILFQNYPNPFNPETKISYKIPEATFVTIKVYDVLGNKVASLVNEDKPVGEYEVEFDGRGLASGIYFYKLQTDIYVETKKMLLFK